MDIQTSSLSVVRAEQYVVLPAEGMTMRRQTGLMTVSGSILLVRNWGKRAFGSFRCRGESRSRWLIQAVAGQWRARMESPCTISATKQSGDSVSTISQRLV